VLALTGLIQHWKNPSRTRCIVGLVANAWSSLFAMTVYSSSTHVIDRFEHSAPWFLGFICLSPLVSLVLYIGTWCWLAFRRR
jgi:hypothetical protein